MVTFVLGHLVCQQRILLSTLLLIAPGSAPESGMCSKGFLGEEGDPCVSEQCDLTELHTGVWYSNAHESSCLGFRHA